MLANSYLDLNPNHIVETPDSGEFQIIVSVTLH